MRIEKWKAEMGNCYRRFGSSKKINTRCLIVGLLIVLLMTGAVAEMCVHASDSSIMRECSISRNDGITDYSISDGAAAEIVNIGIMGENKTSVPPTGENAEGYSASLADILAMLAALMFAFTCMSVLIFLNDRTQRFCHINYIHLSDGSKPEFIM